MKIEGEVKARKPINQSTYQDFHLGGKLNQNRHHRNVEKSNNHSKAKAKVEQCFGAVISHLVEKSANHEAQENVHVDSYHQIALQNGH